MRRVVGSVARESRSQHRWDALGGDRLDEMRRNPAAYRITRSPHTWRPANDGLLKAIGPVAGQRILELGSGRGEFAVYLAQHGATCFGVDVGGELVTASRLLARINGVEPIFVQTGITELPFGDARFDVVVGVGVLHHLSEADAARALREAHRVLAPDGRAIVLECVENSKAFEWIQSLFPAGRRGDRWYRPSILQRSAWKAHAATRDDRPMTNRELREAGSTFHSVRFRGYGLLVRLKRLIGARYAPHLIRLDRAIFAACPPLEYFCQNVLVEYRK